MKKALPLAAGMAAAFALAGSAEPALTIYNQNFAVVRDTVPLDLHAGVNTVRFAGATAQVEPDSVILRDPAGKHSLQILEQNYRNDPVSEPLLLSLFEGKTIEFEKMRVKDKTETRELIPGKIIRSGYVPRYATTYQYGYSPNYRPEQPIIEVNGKLQFSLPGQPLFPDLGDDTVLKPAFNWVLQSDKPGKFDAEVGYVTEGFNWSASYNLVSPEKGNSASLVGWITMNNESGKTFENAKIQLMAGDVSKIVPTVYGMFRLGLPRGGMGGGGGAGGPPPVTEKGFDEYHLYSIARPTTLHDQETKQVEFAHADRMFAPTVYIYDGAKGSLFEGDLITDENFGTQSTKKVQVTREFVNAETNHLGIALPKGKLRFYRRDSDGQLQFVGENSIDHTARNETVRVATGDAFDLVGERTRTNFKMNVFGSTAPLLDPNTGLPYPSSTNKPAVDTGTPWIEESFEIKLRNRKKDTPVEIRVVEHLYRWSNWEITKKSDDYTKKDAQTIEFRIHVKPDEERTVTYSAHYSW
jgi:hypothetical protein